MPRVKRGTMTRKRHSKTIRLAKGYWGGKHRLFKTAKEQVMHAGQYAYRDRRVRKREFRRLWITRISAACRAEGLTYGRFIEALKKSGVELDRKALADLAVADASSFGALIERAKGQLATA